MKEAERIALDKLLQPGAIMEVKRDPLRIPTIHSDDCQCQKFVNERVLVVGYHRIALRIQQSEKHNEVRKAKKK